MACRQEVAQGASHNWTVAVVGLLPTRPPSQVAVYQDNVQS